MFLRTTSTRINVALGKYGYLVALDIQNLREGQYLRYGSRNKVDNEKTRIIRMKNKKAHVTGTLEDLVRTPIAADMPESRRILQNSMNPVRPNSESLNEFMVLFLESAQNHQALFRFTLLFQNNPDFFPVIMVESYEIHRIAFYNPQRFPRTFL